MISSHLGLFILPEFQLWALNIFIAMPRFSDSFTNIVWS